MHIRQSTLSQNVLIVLLFSVCLHCSCARFDAQSSDDYIGPKASEPNAASTTISEANTVSAVSPATAQEALPAEGPLKITIRQATLAALENNKSLVVQQFNPQIKRTAEQQELAAFDPVLTGQLANRQEKITAGPTVSKSNDNSVAAGIQEFLPTGTTLGLTGSTAPVALADSDEYASRIAFSATQSLLRGFGPRVNLVSVNQARLDIKISQYELRGFVQSLAAQVEQTYWDYALAERRIEIFNQSLELARKQLEETRERITIGDLAPSELPAAEAEVALRREDLINARSSLAKIKLNLLRLINPPNPGRSVLAGCGQDAPERVNPPGSNLWNREVTLASLPISPAIELDDVESHVALAFQMRPDLNQAKLLWQRDELEVVKTRNGLLPKLDLFVTLGKTGYADSFGSSVRNLDDDNYDAYIGLAFEYPPLNRAAEARHLRAVLTRQQAREAINNLSQLIEVDVRSAYLEIARSQEQVAATAATRKLQEEKLRSETEKFRIGKSTSLLVAQAQRDLVASQISEIQAVVSYLKAFVEIYRLEGSLLERRGIAAPGRDPVKLPDMPGL